MNLLTDNQKNYDSNTLNADGLDVYEMWFSIGDDVQGLLDKYQGLESIYELEEWEPIIQKNLARGFIA